MCLLIKKNMMQDWKHWKNNKEIVFLNFDSILVIVTRKKNLIGVKVSD